MMYVELVRAKGYDPSIPTGQWCLRPFCIPIPTRSHIICRLFRAANTITLLCNLLYHKYFHLSTPFENRLQFVYNLSNFCNFLPSSTAILCCNSDKII